MKKMLFMLAVVLCLGGMAVLPVIAEEGEQETEVTELNQIMVADEAVEAKEMPDPNSKTVITYEGGKHVFVIGETSDGWYKVSYQDKEGYVPKAALADQELDVEGLNQEFQESETEGRMVIEEVERNRKEAKRSKIWGIVIVLLVVGIFATGIISASGLEKEKKKSNADQSPDQEKGSIIDLDEEE